MNNNHSIKEILQQTDDWEKLIQQRKIKNASLLVSSSKDLINQIIPDVNVELQKSTSFDTIEYFKLVYSYLEKLTIRLELDNYNFEKEIEMCGQIKNRLIEMKLENKLYEGQIFETYLLMITTLEFILKLCLQFKMKDQKVYQQFSEAMVKMDSTMKRDLENRKLQLQSNWDNQNLSQIFDSMQQIIDASAFYREQALKMVGHKPATLNIDKYLQNDRIFLIETIKFSSLKEVISIRESYEQRCVDCTQTLVDSLNQVKNGDINFLKNVERLGTQLLDLKLHIDDTKQISDKYKEIQKQKSLSDQQQNALSTDRTSNQPRSRLNDNFNDRCNTDQASIKYSTKGVSRMTKSQLEGKLTKSKYSDQIPLSSASPQKRNQIFSGRKMIIILDEIGPINNLEPFQDMEIFIKIIEDGLIVKNSRPTKTSDGRLSPQVLQFTIGDLEGGQYEFQLWARDEDQEIIIANSALHIFKFENKINQWQNYSISLLNLGAIITIRVMFDDYTQRKIF